MSLIKVHNLNKIYGDGEIKTHALKDASFVIERGDFVSIMGPSGSGKSTLMQILGFLENASSGEYFFENQEVHKFSDDEKARIRNQKIGFIFQSFNLLPRTTIYENVELPLLYDENHIEMISDNSQKIQKALRSVDMEHRIDYLSNQISGGEQQRVAIARALVNDPEIIFADEPTGNLDSKSGLQIMRILQDLNNQGRTIILVTHETYTAKHAKRILLMKDGKIVSDEAVKDRMIAKSEESLLK